MEHGKSTSLRQWHATEQVEIDGKPSFVKHYQPGCYEVRNELSWLLLTAIRDCVNFTVPDVIGSSISDGMIQMSYIETVAPPPIDQQIDRLVECALELHGLVTSPEPRLRNSSDSANFPSYMMNFASSRINRINEEPGIEIAEDIKSWLCGRVKKLRTPHFSIVHRDLRTRHLLYKESGRPVLIDWEFSCITDSAMDLAKLVYDLVTNHSMKLSEVFNRVVGDYSSGDTRVSKDELTNRVRTFLPIIPLEHLKSMIVRKPDGYEGEVLKDLSFITQAYEKQN